MGKVRPNKAKSKTSKIPKAKTMPKSEEEWKKKLAPEQFRVLRQCGTEPAFIGNYWNNKRKGMYLCAGCGAKLFASETKYDSGTGWPSFYAPISKKDIETKEDRSYGMRRTEVACAKCKGHLGHVFDDGPKPTGKRYCINSAALDFEGEKKI